jgi:hypothetical protein
LNLIVGNKNTPPFPMRADFFWMGPAFVILLYLPRRQAAIYIRLKFTLIALICL